MKYKIGYKVRIKSLKWYSKNKNEDGSIFSPDSDDDYCFAKGMKDYCDREMTIYRVVQEGNYIRYFMREDNGYWGWQEFMFEDNKQLEFNF